MRILLADDHDLVRDTIEEFLKRFDKDLQVFPTASLSQALDLAGGPDRRSAAGGSLS